MQFGLENPVGPVTFADTDCYIVQEAAGEIHIGKSLLFALDIDVEEELLYFGERVEGDGGLMEVDECLGRGPQDCGRIDIRMLIASTNNGVVKEHRETLVHFFRISNVFLRQNYSL